MAFQDWNFGGLKARVSKRVRDIPIVNSDEMLGLAVNKGIDQLFLKAKVMTSILEQHYFVLTSGFHAGQFAYEYPLPPRTLKINGVNIDGYQLQGPMAENEMNAGMFGDSNNTPDPGLDTLPPPTSTTSFMPLGDPREFGVRSEPDGSKTLLLFPRPKQQQWMHVFGCIGPDYLVDDTDVPVIGEINGDSIEYYAAHWLLEGIEGMEDVSERYRQLYMNQRNEDSRNLKLDRVYRIQRQRQW